MENKKQILRGGKFESWLTTEIQYQKGGIVLVFLSSNKNTTTGHSTEESSLRAFGRKSLYYFF